MAVLEKQTKHRFPIGTILLIALIGVPLVEIGLLIEIGGWLGVGPTLVLIVLTAMIGTWTLRRQGFMVLRRAQEQLERGTVPVAEVFEGFCLVIAGALLLTPGFVTDAIGGLLLLPPLRTTLYRQLGRYFEGRVGRTGRGWPEGSPGGSPDRSDGEPPTYDAEFEEIDRDDPPGRGGSTHGQGSMPPSRGGWGRPA